MISKKKVDKNPKVEITNRRELSWEEAVQLQLIYGKNIIQFQKKWWQLLLMIAIHPLSILLLAFSIASLTTHIVGTAIMVIATTHIITLRIIPDPKSEVALQIAKRLVGNQITIIRKLATTGKSKIPIEDVVPGDIVILFNGDTVPGDIQLLESKDLHISQLSFPEDAIPTEKEVVVDNVTDLNCSYFCFMGAKVIQGTAKSVVLRVGNKTALGNSLEQLEKNQHLGNVWAGICIAIPIAFLLAFHEFLNDKELFIAMGLSPEIIQLLKNVISMAIFVRLQLHCIAVAVRQNPTSPEVIVNAYVARSMLILVTAIYIFKPHLGLHYIYLLGLTLGYYIMITFGQKHT